MVFGTKACTWGFLAEPRVLLAPTPKAWLACWALTPGVLESLDRSL